MAITAVRVKRSHSYRYSLEDGQPLPSQDLERKFWVYSDTTDEDPTAVLSAAGLPQYGDAHPQVSAALAQDISMERDEEYPARWEVTVKYMSRRLQGGSGDDGPNADPELITRIAISTVQGERLIEQTIDGDPIATTAGELITGVKIPWNELQIEFTQYRSQLDTEAYYQIAKYRNAINSDTWRGFDPYTARIVSITGNNVNIYGQELLERRITVLLTDPDDPDKPDWRLYLLNAGYYLYRNVTIGDEVINGLVQILDPQTGMPFTKPQRINMDGTAFLSREAPSIYNQYRVYPELPFAALNI